MPIDQCQICKIMYIHWTVAKDNHITVSITVMTYGMILQKRQHTVYLDWIQRLFSCNFQMSNLWLRNSKYYDLKCPYKCSKTCYCFVQNYWNKMSSYILLQKYTTCMDFRNVEDIKHPWVIQNTPVSYHLTRTTTTYMRSFAKVDKLYWLRSSCLFTQV